MPRIFSSSTSTLNSGNSGNGPPSSQPVLGSPWLALVAWGTPLLLAVFFVSLGFEAPLIDLITRGLCVGLAAYIGKHLLYFAPVIPPPVEQEPEAEATDQLSPVYYALSTLDLPLSLQRLVDEFMRLVPCKG